MIWRGKRWDECDQETPGSPRKVRGIHGAGWESVDAHCGRGCSDSWPTWGRASPPHLHAWRGDPAAASAVRIGPCTEAGELVVLDWPFLGENHPQNGSLI